MRGVAGSAQGARAPDPSAPRPPPSAASQPGTCAKGQRVLASCTQGPTALGPTLKEHDPCPGHRPRSALPPPTAGGHRGTGAGMGAQDCGQRRDPGNQVPLALCPAPHLPPPHPRPGRVPSGCGWEKVPRLREWRSPAPARCMTGAREEIPSPALGLPLPKGLLCLQSSAGPEPYNS